MLLLIEVPKKWRRRSSVVLGCGVVDLCKFDPPRMGLKYQL